MLRDHNDAAILAERITEAWQWPKVHRQDRHDCEHWSGPHDDQLTLFLHGTIHIVFGHADGMLRLSYNGGETFSAYLVYFPPDGPPALTEREIDLLKAADAATEGMLTFGARNARDEHLLTWLAH